MAVRIVTDSVADLPPQLVGCLGIRVIPLLVNFGEESFRDGVDIGPDEFYRRLAAGGTYPTTSVPPPEAFLEVYRELAREGAEILVVTLSSRLSGTCEVARQAATEMVGGCRIEVIDSGQAIAAEGLVVISAARAARQGAGLDEVIALVRYNLGRVAMRATFDTLEYLARGGRIGRAQALLGSVLHVNPVIGLRDGEVYPYGRERSRQRAINRLYEFAAGYRNIEAAAVEYATALPEAEALAERLARLVDRDRIMVTQASPVIGTHTGPGLLVVSILGDR